MHTGHETPPVRCSSTDLSALSADLLCLPVFADEDPTRLASLDAATGGAIARGRASGEITGERHTRWFTDIADAAWQCRRLLLIGAGARDQYAEAQSRMLGGVAGMAAHTTKARRLALVAPAGAGTPTMVRALVEGALLGVFRDNRFKSDPPNGAVLTALEIVRGPGEGAQDADTQQAADRGALLAGCTNLAKELANEPGNLFTPRVFADRAIELVSGPRTSVEVLDETAIASHGMGLLQGVAQGSAEPPRVIVMRYEPEHLTEGPVLALVGKGVTFDTGGISIKPADGMDRMKRDMAGGAAVLGAMRAIGLLAPRVRVIGIIPAAENMPGSRALRPGDVLTAANGKQVEVLNTDAEGRLILGDALVLAQRLGATHLVDIATLTGSVVVALGHHASGLLGSPPSWVDSVQRVADGAGERVWPFPMFDEYAEQLKSDTADIANVGGRAGGTITAGMFLKAFAGDLPWAHLDIAGTAWHEDELPYHAKGATGVGVRTLATLPFDATW